MDNAENTRLMNEDPQSSNHDKVHQGKSLIHLFFKFVDRLNEGIAWFAGLALVSMMLLIVFNAIKRIFTDPFSGTVEVVGWLAALTAIFSLGYAQLHKAHVYIDMLIDNFHPTIQKVTHTLMNILSIVFFTIAAWQIILYGISLMESNTVSETLQIPFYPLIILSSLGFISLVLALMKETIIIWRRVT